LGQLRPGAVRAATPEPVRPGRAVVAGARDAPRPPARARQTETETFLKVPLRTAVPIPSLEVDIA
jgi:hypothetical protein